MNIGAPKEVREVEPLTEPVPEPVQLPLPEPSPAAEPAPAPAPAGDVPEPAVRPSGSGTPGRRRNGSVALASEG